MGDLVADAESILLELDSQEEARFWAKVQKCGPDDCWPWIAKSITWGYGSWRVRKVLFRSNRVAWVLTKRQLVPDGLDVRHSCHNRACCNPAHLSPGTRKQNMQDSVRAGRTKGIRVGSKNGRAQLDEAKVRKIKHMLKSGVRHVDIAERVGISRSMITLINTGHSWSHVTIS
jgi:hypothetical protein